MQVVNFKMKEGWKGGWKGGRKERNKPGTYELLFAFCDKSKLFKYNKKIRN